MSRYKGEKFMFEQDELIIRIMCKFDLLTEANKKDVLSYADKLISGNSEQEVT